MSLIAVAAVVAGMLLTSRPASRALARKAPDFTLSDTDGQVVRLEQFRGINVLLSFNAGAGCQPCLVQLAQIEKNARSRTGKSPSCPSVINDSGGQHRSFGEYPSMWLSVSDLLAQVNEHRST
ncbi:MULTISPECIES: peroxiredoxin family protein [unclassified Ornithinimicrobium]|uniref:peroxiredoxin family protein n=1 Tax=unclassified Ornithinimicrobium TaxID=2615080 RepID=UPI003854CD52